jgi:hypothetical protein
MLSFVFLLKLRIISKKGRFESTSNKLMIASLKTEATDSICSKVVQCFHKIRAVNVPKVLYCIGFQLVK